MELDPKDLDQTFLDAATARRDLFFVNILMPGVYESPAAILTEAQQVNIQFPYELFLVLIAKKEHWGEAYASGEADAKEQHFILRNALENGFPGLCFAANVHGEMTAILNLPALPETGVRGIVQDASHILEVLDAEFGISVTMSISRVYHSLLELPLAYLDCQHIMEYQQLLGEDIPVVEYESLTHMHIPQPESSYLDLELQILTAAKSQDFSGLQIALHKLISNEFGTGKPTVDTVRFRVYGFVNTLLSLMNEIRPIVGEQFIETLDVGPRLTEALSLPDIVQEMDDILDALIQRIDQQRSTAPPLWAKQARQYIRDNFRDPDLTVTSVADWLQLTPTYCSKVYREVYGVRLLDEIQQLRLEEAKRLMVLEPTLAIIAEKSGFPSALTMSRAFKRYVGVSPGMYRDQLRTN